MFGCSDYPQPNDISTAPSICLGQFAEKGIPVLANAKQYFGNIQMAQPYSEVCTHNCYQNYARSATIFLNNCYYELVKTANPLAALISLDAFFGINCGNLLYGFNIIVSYLQCLMYS